MTIQQLINKLKKLDPELEVFLPISNGIGNISPLRNVKPSTYGFFGKSIPCVILDKNNESLFK